MFVRKKDFVEKNKDVSSTFLFYKDEIRDIQYRIGEEIQNLKKEFRNQLEAEKEKFNEKLNLVISSPPKYKKGDTVMYGDKEYIVYEIALRCYKYVYSIVESDFKHSSHTKEVKEDALYTKKKK
tara:strand:- start:280 stop:651 length:372 start_codon:yes stop_codon:yes gene_type:complete